MPQSDLPGGRGITFAPFESRADVIVRTAQLADRCGFGGFALAEAAGNASPPLLAEIALTTDDLELSTCVLSVWSRSPAVLAMTATGLQRMAGGRFVLGLGASTPPLVEGLHGSTWEDPVDKLRSVLVAVRKLLDGHRLPKPANGARPLGMATTPGQPIPLGLAALSPRTIAMAGELADRWLPFLWPRSRLAEGRRLLADGASAVRRQTLPAIVPAVPLAVGADRETAERTAARWLITYCTRMGPIYPRLLRERFGYTAEVDALLAANADGGTPVLPHASRRLADDVLLLTTHDDIDGAVSGWTDAGADRVDLVLPIGAPEDAVWTIVHAAAPTAARRPAVPSGARP